MLEPAIYQFGLISKLRRGIGGGGPTLDAQRSSSDLVLMYKVVHNLVAVPIAYHPPRWPRYMECVRFITYHCCVNVYQHSFFPRTVIMWNQLPESTINLESLDSFKLAVQPPTPM